MSDVNEKNKHQELISFLTPFSINEKDIIQPVTRYKVKHFPESIKLKLQIGLINLKKNAKYSIKIFITPYSLYTTVGESFELGDPFQEVIAGALITKDSDSRIIDGQLNVDIDDVTFPTEGIYSIECALLDSENENIKLHSLKSYIVAAKG
ncbi:hypothetical protein [Providencia stuartii]|uniref:hypothetical protein n=1 Tax=Providencia stuartii TaxID=588 RepID=UPI0034E4EC00